MRARSQDGRDDPKRATDREVSVVAAVVAAGSEKAAAHRLGLAHSEEARLAAGTGSRAAVERQDGEFLWHFAGDYEGLRLDPREH